MEAIGMPKPVIAKKTDKRVFPTPSPNHPAQGCILPGSIINATKGNTIYRYNSSNYLQRGSIATVRKSVQDLFSI